MSQDSSPKIKSKWALLLLILAGIVLGGFIGQQAQGIEALSFLNYGQEFGLTNPLTLNLGIITITFALTIKITITGIIGIILGIIIYRLM